ncbi:MAG TPA: L,D-transpeptidase [Patescibacteria group bacterium]|nr:L,D-transpeptidase [Patescibacteria group bacterium]
MIKKILTLFLLLTVLFGISLFFQPQREEAVLGEVQGRHWLLLYRSSNVEYLYFGIPGDAEKSTLVKTFSVKTGIPGERPTPLPQLVGRDYWIITGKEEQKDNPETAPYFLTLDVPVGDEEPYGPTPYLECNGSASTRGEQCNWILPGAFGLHGVAGDLSKLASDNPGSSGCIRHTDEDITYLYNLLDPEKEEIRYYIVK